MSAPTQNTDRTQIAEQIGLLSESGRAIALALSCEEIHETMSEQDIITLALEITDKLAQINALSKLM